MIADRVGKNIVPGSRVVYVGRHELKTGVVKTITLGDYNSVSIKVKPDGVGSWGAQAVALHRPERIVVLS